MHESTIHQEALKLLVLSSNIRVRTPYAQPSKRIFFLKLLLYFVDFTYLPCSLAKRSARWRPVAVMGTGRGTRKPLPQLFKDRVEHAGHLGRQGALPTN